MSEAKKGIVVWFRIVDAMYLVILNIVVDKISNFIYVDPLHTLFCRKLRFVAIYALFGDLWAKKVPFCGIKKMTLLPL